MQASSSDVGLKRLVAVKNALWDWVRLATFAYGG